MRIVGKLNLQKKNCFITPSQEIDKIITLLSEIPKEECATLFNLEVVKKILYCGYEELFLKVAALKDPVNTDLEAIRILFALPMKYPNQMIQLINLFEYPEKYLTGMSSFDFSPLSTNGEDSKKCIYFMLKNISKDKLKQLQNKEGFDDQALKIIKEGLELQQSTSITLRFSSDESIKSEQDNKEMPQVSHHEIKKGNKP